MGNDLTGSDINGIFTIQSLRQSPNLPLKKKTARSGFAAGSGFIGNIGYSGRAARFYEPVTDPSED